MITLSPNVPDEVEKNDLNPNSPDELGGEDILAAIRRALPPSQVSRFGPARAHRAFPVGPVAFYRPATRNSNHASAT
jgi:hypothetical protein